MRKRVPHDLRTFIGRAEIWKSLHTDSRKIAVRRLAAASAQIEADFERAREKACLIIDSTLLSPWKDDAGAVIHPSTPKAEAVAIEDLQKAGPTLAETYQSYLNDPTRSWAPTTRQSYETTKSVATSVLGGDRPISMLSRSDVRKLLEALRVLPKNAVKLFPNLTLAEAANLGRADPSIARISSANANAYLGNFSTFLNWCVGEELISRNPARGLRLPDEVSKREKRHPFSAEQLKLIFQAPLFTGCLDGERNYASQGEKRPRNARFWVPTIGLHTGMRLNEICQLDTSDIRSVEGVPCIVVSRASLNGSSDKILKTAASERIIPIHPTLIELGLLSFAEGKRRSGQKKLFHDIEGGARGVRAVAFSKWFTQFLVSAGARKERTSFHSFRHNFRDELRIARVDHDVAMALGGWIGGQSSSSAASENYGNGHRIDVLQAAVSRLLFSEIDLSHLRKADR